MDKLRLLIESMKGVNKYPLLERSEWDSNWLAEIKVGYASVAFLIGIRVKGLFMISKSNAKFLFCFCFCFLLMNE